ncbi:MAG TPA: hypothetical protein VKV95_01520 [Terriglobia bacterium]|nr:hypothetical protein [Terriglobia bacterium]
MKGLARDVLSRLSFSPDFPFILMGGAALILTGALGLILHARWRRKTPEEQERLRRLAINRTGRVTYGQIVDWLEPPPGKKGARLVVFKYEVAGVKYDAAQDISALPTVVVRIRESIGQQARLKYDVDHPGNSIIACEEWSGLLQYSPAQVARSKPSLKSEA